MPKSPSDPTLRINPVHESEASRNNPILDRCWASHISAAGGVLGILAAKEIMSKNYGKGAVLAGASALMDFFDGLEARRFAKRHPEAGLERKNKGGWEDQIWDRIRNIAIGSAVLTVQEVPGQARKIIGGMVAKETVTGIVGIRTLANHYVQHGEGWPAPIPSADRGKEAMWEVGAGLSGVLLGAKVAKTNPELGKQIGETAGKLCAVGLFRGLQTVPEYTRVMKEMAVLTPEDQLMYTPNYKPHIVGRVMQLRQGLQARLQEFNDVQNMPRHEAA